MNSGYLFIAVAVDPIFEQFLLHLKLMRELLMQPCWSLPTLKSSSI